MIKTIIVGLGNPILTDDGVGVKVAYEIQNQLGPHLPAGLTITEASVGGLRLMELLEDFDRAIIIDAIQTRNGHQPGTIFTMSLDDLRTLSHTQHITSSHDTSLVTALEVGKSIGMKLPEEISIFAVEVENIMDFSEDMTPAVAATISKVTEMVLRIL